MNKYWRKARSNHKIQLIHIIQSFSKDEFKRDNPDDVLKANMIGQELVSEHYKGRQALICTQADGKGECVHNHILINDVSMLDSKGCVNNEYHHKNVMEWSDEITAKYIIPVEAEKCYEKLTRNEILKREKGDYVYKDDIRIRVTQAMKKSVSEDDFIDKLSENGVGVTKKKSPKYGEYYVYELLDLSDVPNGAKLPDRALKSRSYKLGADYGPQALYEAIKDYKAPKKWGGPGVTFTSGALMNMPENTSAEKRKSEYTYLHKNSVSEEEKTEEFAASLPVSQSDIQQEVIAAPIIDIEEDEIDEKQEKYLKRQFMRNNKTMHNSRASNQIKYDRKRFDKTIGTAVSDSEKEYGEFEK